MSLSLSSAHRAPSHVTAKVARPSITLMLRVWSERRALARMDESRLADLGLTSVDAAREAARPIWDLPYRCS